MPTARGEVRKLRRNLRTYIPTQFAQFSGVSPIANSLKKKKRPDYEEYEEYDPRENV